MEKEKNDDDGNLLFEGVYFDVERWNGKGKKIKRY